MTQGEDDATAVGDAFAAGDETALSAVYSEWSSLIYSVALRSLDDDVDEAEDVTQRVFTGAWASRQLLIPAQTTLPAWLIGILRLELARTQRAPSRSTRAGAPAGTTTQDREPMDPGDLADLLLVADEMSRSSDGPHRAIRLALVDGLTPAQIAERMDVSGSVVSSHLSRGLHELQKRLAVLHDAR